MSESEETVRNGSHHTASRVELGDTIVVAASLPSAGTRPRELEFEVVGIVGDEAGVALFAICYCTSVDEFMVADASGAVLADEALAQEILNEFLEHAAADDVSGDAP
jgi:hypothetical protein